jgi:hypothetical protein
MRLAAAAWLQDLKAGAWAPRLVHSPGRSRQQAADVLAANCSGIHACSGRRCNASGWAACARGRVRYSASNSSHSIAAEAVASLDATVRETNISCSAALTCGRYCEALTRCSRLQLTTVYETHGLSIGRAASHIYAQHDRANHLPGQQVLGALAGVPPQHQQHASSAATSSGGADPEDSACTLVTPNGRLTVSTTHVTVTRGPAAPSSSSSSSSRRDGAASTGSGARSSGSAGQADNWLEAVLSATTNRLSSSTNEAVIHSLNRLASLRSAHGPSPSMAVAFGSLAAGSETTPSGQRTPRPAGMLPSLL